VSHVMSPVRGSPPPRRRRDPVRTTVRGLGELLLTAGLVVLLFVFYEAYVTDWTSAQKQRQATAKLDDTWSNGRGVVDRPVKGAGIAKMYVPAFGPDFMFTVLEGTDQDVLAVGPGHYQGTASPGQLGNFGVAGHRVGRGSPFLDVDTLRPGDPLVVETASWWYVYRVLGPDDPSGIPGTEVVAPTDVSVIDPLPDRPAGTAADGAYLTLTTCNPKFSARERLVVHARLDGAPMSRRDAPHGPAALREGTPTVR